MAKTKITPSEVKVKTVDPRNRLNDLTATEWIPETVSVWTQKGLGANHPDASIEKQHPAPFSYTDVSRLIRFFTKKGNVVLDPFVGIGSTLKACALEGRKGVGFELSKKYANLAKERLKSEVSDSKLKLQEQTILEGDSRKLIETFDDDYFDYIVTSPPYWNILHKIDKKASQERVSKNLDTKYSINKKDLGNIDDYSVFLDELCSLLGRCGQKLKTKKYMSVIVSDFRDKSNFIMFHSDIANELKKYNFQLKGITILYQRHKGIFPYGYPYSFVSNIHHQYIMTFQNTK